MRITNAKPEDAPLLSAIAHAAKRSWGYPESWMASWKAILTISQEYLAAHHSFVAVFEEKVIGFAVLEIAGRQGRLEHLWVCPGNMRSGVGGALFDRCEEVARSAGVENIEIESDPNAEAFYLRMGAIRVGEISTDIDGVKRSLPFLIKRL